MTTSKALTAELLGTLWLVLGGCGSAVFAAYFLGGPEPVQLGIGFLGVSLAFGLTVVTGAYAFGHVSGGHFNPAVTLGLVAGGKFEAAKAVPYIIAQVIGGLIGGLIIYAVASGQAGWEITGGAGAFATNGFGDYSPGGYSLGAVLLAEAVLTAVFLFIILGSTGKRAAVGMAGMSIGLGLTLIHLISIPISNTSVNPARSTSQAVLTAIFGSDGVGDAASATAPVEQLWAFWVAPIVGAIIAGVLHRSLLDTDHVIDA